MGGVEAANGLAAIPAIRISHLSDAEKRAHILADNRLAEKAGRDCEILAVELQALIDLDLRGRTQGGSKRQTSTRSWTRRPKRMVSRRVRRPAIDLPRLCKDGPARFGA